VTLGASLSESLSSFSSSSHVVGCCCVGCCAYKYTQRRVHCCI
jgi:hypothetical protein